jgi:FkbM family methyltransferase
VTYKRKLFNWASDLTISLFGLNRPCRILRAFSNRINSVKKINLNNTTLLFDANEELHLLRAIWLESKEPETIQWINTFPPGAVFYDIGANIGVFSLYAALHGQCTVIAFEPEAKNYACLYKNIFLNNADEKIKAYNLALHDKNCTEHLFLHDLMSGSALHSIEQPIDWRKNTYAAKHAQAVIAYTLDDFIDHYHPPFPTHIKLDVDGNEFKIISGAIRTLSDKRCRSLLIELNENDQKLIDLIESCGLKLAQKTKAAMQGEYEDVYNTVFYRE